MGVPENTAILSIKDDLLPVFVYGTLLSPKVRQAVCGQVLDTFPCRLSGFQRICPNAYVDGAVFFIEDRKYIQLLDDYEGSEYDRKSLPVSKSEGEREVFCAWLYVLKPKYYDLVINEDWDFDSFQAKQCRHYLENLR